MAGRHLGSAGTLLQSTTAPAPGHARGEGLLPLGGHSPHNELSGRKPSDLTCRWLNQPARSLLPGRREDALSPFLWDSGCVGHHCPSRARSEFGQGDRRPKNSGLPFIFLRASQPAQPRRDFLCPCFHRAGNCRFKRVRGGGKRPAGPGRCPHDPAAHAAPRAACDRRRHGSSPLSSPPAPSLVALPSG